MYAWTKAAREGRLDIGSGSHTPETAMSLARKQVKEQEKEIRRLKKENEFLKEASAFFAASRRMTVEEVKALFWRYFISYWNNRRIYSSNEGLPPMVKRQRYYESLGSAA